MRSKDHRKYLLRGGIVILVFLIFRKMGLGNFIFTTSSPEIYSDIDTDLTAENTAGQVINWRPLLGWTVDREICWHREDDENFVLAHLNNPPDTPIYVYPETVDEYVSKAIIRTGAYEGDNVKTLIRYMNRFPDAVFIDLGAMVGSFSIPIAALGYRVVAVECLRSSVKRLCASMKEANVANRLTVVHNAVTDKHERISFETEKGNIGLTYIVDVDIGEDPVDTIILDDLLEIYDLEQVVMKMDVYKYEDTVLNGAHKFFKQVRVEALLMEFVHHQKDKYDLDGKFIVDFLAFHGLEPDVPDNVKHDYKAWNTSEILFRRVT